MKLITRKDIVGEALPGRTIQKAVGKQSVSSSGKMTIGFGYYSNDQGPMEPHQHAEEVIYVVDAKKARARYGPEKDRLAESIDLEPGMLLHFPELEWHVFEYDGGGYLDIMFIYGQVDKIRPEEMD